MQNPGGGRRGGGGGGREDWYLKLTHALYTRFSCGKTGLLVRQTFIHSFIHFTYLHVYTDYKALRYTMNIKNYEIILQ